MGNGLKHALFDHWWAWDHPDTRKAVLAGLMPHFLKVVEARFEKNQRVKPPYSPAGWKDMEVLRSEATFRRLLNGERNPPTEFLLGVASLLRVDPGTLFPPLAEWVAEATFYLVAPRVVITEAEMNRVVGFDRAAARVYAKAVLEHPPCRQAVADGEIDDFLARCPPAVRTVATKIAGRLADYHAELKKDSGTGGSR